MKKAFLLSILATLTLLVFTSCNDDDSLQQDKIIGKWKKTKVVENGVEQKPNCTYEGILEYKSDGTYVSERFFDTNTNFDILDCSLFSTTTGTWVSNGNNSYTSTTAGVASNVEFIFEGNNTYVFTFESNGFVAVLTYKRQ